jgi:hypothetical protein
LRLRQIRCVYPHSCLQNLERRLCTRLLTARTFQTASELIERYRGHVNSGIVEQECEATVPFDHGIKELLDRSVVGHIGDMRLNQSRA